MGRAATLPRPVRGERARWRAWACWARSGLANASLARAQAVQGDHQCQGMLLDKVKVRGEDLREGWHAGRHGARHGIVFALSTL